MEELNAIIQNLSPEDLTREEAQELINYFDRVAGLEMDLHKNLLISQAKIKLLKRIIALDKIKVESINKQWE